MTECEGKTSNEKREADQAMNALALLFSSPEVKAKAHHRCGISGPTEVEVVIEAALDDVFGRDPNSEYKRWIRRLYKLGIISHMPDDWKDQNP
jgi:hypothetical protein